ncbi:MAG: glycosyltransferase family 8 protein [Treponema sp.]|jgi:lipopolysaccharide biosynthesis glycosyltransferase|nr:glycosyltransferase family 8 protein [Treponema sp.]
MIPIVFSSDDYYVPYMGVMMQSIMENAVSDEEYRFYVLQKNISSENREALKTQIGTYPHFSIDFINVAEYIKDYNFFVANRDNITIETYFRLLIPDLFKDQEKIIYLDGDMICLTSISELYHYELGNNLLASSRDILGACVYYSPNAHTQRTYRREILKLSNPDNYFIAGMLLINNREFRKRFTVKQLLDFAVSREWQWHDQDVLNVLCDGKTLLLSMAWDFTQDDVTYLPEYLRKEYVEAQKEPKIIHFASQSRKPWENAVNVPYFELFWKYAARTPFLVTIISRMEEKHLIGLPYKERILYDIKNKNIGLKFLLTCLKARLWG